MVTVAWDLVIFDCDGVLIDSEPISNRLFAECVTELGYPLTVEQSTVEFTGLPTTTCLELIAHRWGKPIPPGFEANYEARVIEAFRTELKPMPGIVDALARIELPICVASGGTIHRVQLALEMTGLLPFFDGRIFSSRQVSRGKPFPDVFLFAAEQLRAEPTRCVVVEDSLYGVQAGIAAGMHVFAYAPDDNRSRLAVEGAKIFNDFRELPELLGPRAVLSSE
jgi:HAD superfamily hydrolase (TIGR01509 family)